MKGRLLGLVRHCQQTGRTVSPTFAVMALSRLRHPILTVKNNVVGAFHHSFLHSSGATLSPFGSYWCKIALHNVIILYPPMAILLGSTKIKPLHALANSIPFTVLLHSGKHTAW